MSREYRTDKRGSTFYLDEGRKHYHGALVSPYNPEESRPATQDEINAYAAKEQEIDARRKAAAEEMEAKALAMIPRYGFDPREVGCRPRGFWEEDGELVICARDGGSNPVDCKAGNFGKFLGTDTDGHDCTYRYYRYAPK